MNSNVYAVYLPPCAYVSVQAELLDSSSSCTSYF